VTLTPASLAAVTGLVAEEIILRLEGQVEHYRNQPEVRVGLDLAMRVTRTLATRVDAGELPAVWRVLLDQHEDEPDEDHET
jgi:hypothetical protein